MSRTAIWLRRVPSRARYFDGPAGLELVGDDERLVAHAGLLPLAAAGRADRPRAGAVGGDAPAGSSPLYDRGQLLTDLALVLIAAVRRSAISRRWRPAPADRPGSLDAATVWRALSEAGDLQLARLNAAVTEFRRRWWSLLAARPEGFPWLKVAGRELTGVTVAGLDATIVFAASGKNKAVATYKGAVSALARTWPTW